MKKIFAMALLLLAAVSFSSCGVPVALNEISGSETSPAATNANPGATGTENPTEARSLPEYVPGSINLIPEEELRADDNWAFFPKYRLIYYTINGAFTALGAYKNRSDSDRSSFWAQLEERRVVDGKYSDIDEMDLVVFIKYFQISKDDFISAVSKQRENQALLGQDETAESFELPNADIIYTFDNDIINYYYRRE